MAAHPTPADLSAFLRGELRADPAVADHLESCPDCLGRMAVLRDDSDPLLAALRAAGASDGDAAETLPHTPVAAGPPTDLPGYTVGRLLGRGGMAVVYAADSLVLNRPVAVKLLRAADPDPSALARFRAEALALGRLQHPNVVQVFDAGTAADGRPFVVLEYVPGGTLGDLGKVSPGRAAGLVRAVAGGVQAAHAAGVIHRDLKPSNVLLADDGTPKVGDFGLAKLSDAGRDLTATGTVAGTPAYMAPEQAAGGLPAPAADVYGLGGLLYELLTGRPPFDADSVPEILRKVREEPPAPLPRSVPRDLATVAGKCLRKEPGKRYASAAEVADDLDRFLAGRPILARPVGPAERVGKWVRRHPAVTALAVALLLAVAGGATAVGVQLGRTERARREADRERDRARLVAAEQALDQGILLCEGGRVADGLEQFDTAAGLVPESAPELAYAVRLNRELWAAERRTLWPLSPLEYKRSRLTAVAFSPDGRRLLTADRGDHEGKPSPGLAVVWDAADPSRRAIAAEHPGPATAVAWQPAGAGFVTGGQDGTVRVWDDRGRPTGEPLAVGGPVAGVGFDPAGKRLAAVAAGVLHLWAWPARTPLGEPVKLPVDGRSLAWSADGKLLAVAGRTPAGGGAVAVLDPATGVLPNGPSTADPLRAVVWHPAGWLAAGGDDGTVRCWEADGRRRPGLFQHLLPVNALRVTPDGAVLVAALGDPLPSTPDEGPGEVQCWEVASCSRLGPPLANTMSAGCNRVTDVAVSSDGTRLAAATENGYGWVADLPRPAAAVARAEVGAPAYNAAFSPDGKRLAVWAGPVSPFDDINANPGEVRLFDARTLAPTGRFRTPNRPLLVFHPAGHTLLCGPFGGADGPVQLWDVAAGRLTPGPGGPVTFAGWSADGAELWTVTADGQLRRWDAATRAAVGGPVSLGNLAILDVDANPGLVGRAADGLVAWTPAGGRVRLDAVGETDGYHDAAFVAGGRVVVTAAHPPDGSTLVSSWNPATGARLGGPREYPMRAFPVPAGADGLVLVTYADGRNTYQPADPRSLAPLGPAVPHNEAFAVHPSGRYFATASGPLDGRVRLVGWAGRTLGPPVPHPGRTFLAKFNPAGDLLLTAGDDRTVRLWAVPPGG